MKEYTVVTWRTEKNSSKANGISTMSKNLTDFSKTNEVKEVDSY